MTRALRFLIRHPKATLASIAAITAVFALFLPRLGFEADYSKMLPQGDPVVAQYEVAREVFGGQSLFMFAMAGEEGGTIFDLPSLRKLYALTSELQVLVDERLVEEVVSPATVKIVEGTATAITVRPILPRPPESEEDVALFREKVLAERMVRDTLVRADGSGAVIVLRVAPDLEDNEEAMGRVLDHLKAVEARYAQPEKFYISGDAAFLVYVNRNMRQDLALLLPVVVAVVVAVLFLSFQSLRGVLLPLGVVLVALVWTMGLMALVGAKLTMISTFMPVLLVAVGSAYGIHVVNDHAELARAGGERRELAERVALEMLLPLAGAALTTAAGFLTLLTSFLVPTREFGLFAAVGTVVAFVLALTLIPAVLALLPPRPKRTRSVPWFDGLADRSSRFLARRPVVTLGLAVAVLGALLAGVPWVRVESDLTKYFRADSPVVEGLRFVERQFGGSQELSVVVDTGRRNGLKDPEVLRFMDRLQAFLEARPEVGATSSLADLVKETYFTLRGDDPAFYTLPTTSRAVAQTLILYESGGGEVTSSLATRDFAQGRVSARVRSVGLSGYEQLTQAVEEFLAQQKPAAVVSYYVTGSPALYIQLSKKIIRSQLVSLGASFGAVGAIVSLLMLSWGAGLLSLVPLVVAVGGNFGIMGYAGAYLDMATIMIASLSVGIGVDYAVHFLARYRRARGQGLSHAQALQETFRFAGKAIVVNAVTLTLGFLVMLLSRFGALVTFGWLVAVTMITSLLGALFILPAVLAWIPPRWVLPAWRPVHPRVAVHRAHSPGGDGDEGGLR